MATNITEILIEKFGNNLINLFSYILYTGGYFILLIIIFLILILAIKRGAPVSIETIFGKIKIFFSKKQNNNITNMCELCRINIVTLITQVIEFCQTINKIEQKNIHEQIRVLDSQFVILASWMNNLHVQMVDEKIKLIQNISEEEKIKIFIKNNQLLNFAWLIEKQFIYDFFKEIILSNNFCNLNQAEFQLFVYEKSNLLEALWENNSKFYPDWDDSGLILKRNEYIKIKKEKLILEIPRIVHLILEKCKAIQQEYFKKIKDIESKRMEMVDSFKNSLPLKNN